MNPQRSDNPEDQDPSQFPGRSAEKPKRKSLDMPIENTEEEKEETNPPQRERRRSTPTKRPSSAAAELPPEKSGRDREALEGQESLAQQLQPLSNQPTAGAAAGGAAAGGAAAVGAAAGGAAAGGASAAEDAARWISIYSKYGVYFRTTEDSSYCRSRENPSGGVETGSYSALPATQPPTANPELLSSNPPELRFSFQTDLPPPLRRSGALPAVDPGTEAAAVRAHMEAAASAKQETGNYVCPNCGHGFDSVGRLAVHIHDEMQALERSTKRSTEYVYGNLTLDSFAELVRHIRRTHPAATGSSKQEEKATSSSEPGALSAGDEPKAGPSGWQASQAQAGSQEQERQPAFKCNCCPSKRFPSAESLLAHIRASWGNEFSTTVHCPFCLPKLVKYSNKGSLTRHLNQQHKDRPQYECPHCFKKFHYGGELQRHLKDSSEEGCGKHNEEFHVGFAIIWHMEPHCTTGAYLCNSCGRRFANRIDYFTHRVRCHTGHCYLCNQVFKTATERALHIRKEHGVQKEPSPDSFFRCPLCFKTYQDCSDYIKHIYLCEDIIPPCVSCGRTFDTRTELLQHIARHYKAKPLHSCPKCSKSFSSRSKLTSHLKTRHRKEE